MLDQNQLKEYVFILGDNAMILGHRLSELCGHGPNLETDIALTNISLDLFGQVRSYFQYAAKLEGGEATEDSMAYNRTERQIRNAILLEQPNTDFAYVITRQFLFDVYHKLLMEELINSTDESIKEIAIKGLKEVKYHQLFSSEWMRRLGVGTDVSNAKLQQALNDLYPFINELYTPTEIEVKTAQAGIGPNLDKLKDKYLKEIHKVIEASNLKISERPPRFAKGKEGLHTEHMGFILAEFQYMQKTYPNLVW
jgi:ring-1,2-phenylacetyl-CoA epoxidase subunit PaaC